MGGTIPEIQYMSESLSVRHFFIRTFNMETKQSKGPEMFLPEDSSFYAGHERARMRSLIAVVLAPKDHRERNPHLTRERGLVRKLHRHVWTRTP